MKNKSAALLILTVCLVSIQAFGQVLIGRNFWDRSSHPTYGNRIQCFTQWSLLPRWQVTAEQGFMYHDLPFLNYRYQYIPEVPFIGKYGSPYKFRHKILIINASSDMLEIAPRNMRQSIIPNVNQFQNIGEIMAIASDSCDYRQRNPS